MRQAIICLFVLIAVWSSSASGLTQSAYNQARVGVLSLQSLENEEADGIGASAVRAGMQALGYIEHENLVLVVRHARGDRTQLRSLAAELVAARVQVIVAIGTQATDAAREATTSIPIIMAAVGDPLGSGFVQSLARPGGNVTGIANWSPEAAAKQLELLKEAVPTIHKVAVLHVSSASHMRMLPLLERMAKNLLLLVDPALIGTPDDLRRRFAEMNSSGVDAVLVLGSPIFDDLYREIGELSLRYGLPGAGHQPYYVRSGFLLSYGPILADLHTRSAVYVDKILKGAKPADLPVEQAERFKLVINLKTAKALNVLIPPTLLARADEVIE